MPTTHSNLVPVRRVAVGVSASAQGLDGVSELTRTAEDALSVAAWSVSTEAPAIPVHDYDRALPSGDAWKACYGYDADARTERGACGAVCYTFPVPADALIGDPCSVTALALSVQGDRYLAAGADLHVVFSTDAQPPTVAELLARTPDHTGLCATSGQSGEPNNRHGVCATVQIEPAAQAATAYIHVALLLTDYQAARGAWIEGGALLVSGSISVTFSRNVNPDDAISVSLGLGGPFDSTKAAWAWDRAYYIPGPRQSVKYERLISYGELVAAKMADPIGDALASLEIVDVSSQLPDSSGGNVFNAIDISGQDQNVSVLLFSGENSVPSPTILALVRSGFFPEMLADGLSFSSPIENVSIPLQFCVYKATTPVRTYMPGADIFRRDFWQGGMDSLNILASAVNLNAKSVWIDKEDATPAPFSTFSVPSQFLGSARIARGNSISRIDFEMPVHIDEGLNTILVAIRPNGRPTTYSDAVEITPQLEFSLFGR